MDKENKYWLSLPEHNKLPKPSLGHDTSVHKKTGDHNKPSPQLKESVKPEFLSPLPNILELSTSRREFLQIMGASLALTSTACLRRPTEKIVPYVNRPVDIIPGEANYYASSYYDGEEGFAVLIKAREGRPIKIEGNDLAKPLNGQALSPRAGAYILSLYDPERAKKAYQNLFNDQKSNKESISVSYQELDKAVVEKLNEAPSALLTNRIPSPSAQKIFNKFCSEFKAKHYVWDPVSREDLVKAQKRCYGQEIIPSYNIEKAEFILALNCDFLGTYLSPTEFQKQFAKTRQPDSKMSRLIVLESRMSLTGANADERYRLSGKDNLTALLALSDQLIQKRAFSAPTALQSLIKSYQPHFKKLAIPQSQWSEWADQLMQKKGKSLILFGALKSPQSLESHIVANFLNSALNNDGKTINHSNYYPYQQGSGEQIEQLIKALNQGTIKNLIIHGLNPVYSYPDKEKLLSAFKKAELIVYTGDRMDETGFYADYLMPDSHPLEKWSDWEFKKNVLSIQQPAIQALYQTRAFEDSLISWIKIKKPKSSLPQSFYEFIKKQYTGISWNRFLKEGFYVKQKSQNRLSRNFNNKALKAIKKSPPSKNNTLSLNLYESSALKRGDLSNVAWLMEFPDPVSKICWENYLSVSPQLAEEQKLKEGQIVQLTTKQQKKVFAPIHIQPGQEDHTLSLAVGYGHSRSGVVGNNKGVNAYPLITQGEMESLEVEIQKTSRHIALANVQGHHSMEGRDIILESTLKEFKQDPSSGIPKHHKVPSLWSKHKYKGHKWGMTIDLNSCNGCGTCMIACQSENNIPTVGKKYVLQGREMHWIRVDRYYKGPPSQPETVHQPVVCMHCDNAPCETVCPVLATVHSDEGTNDMVYNRCVGTRYCSNNCPYKVRRFNWFDYTKKEKPLNMVLNPDVTVRHRGVMEKCSFCVQKIQAGKARAKKENRELKDGDIKTACQSACPAQAITFGDLNDPNSQVSQSFNAKNSYALLDDMLNTKPAVKYQTKIRNKKPAPKDKKNQYKKH